MTLEYLAIFVFILFLIQIAWLQININRIEKKIDNLTIDNNRIFHSLEFWKKYEQRYGLNIKTK